MTLPAHITLEDTFDDWVSDFNTLIDHVGTLGGGTSNTLELTTSTGYKSYVHASIYDGIELIANRIPGSFPAVTPNTSLATASIGIFTYDGDSFIGFNTGNTNGGGDTTRMSISGNGYVGIGTSNPTSLLHVVGSTLMSGALTVSGNAAFDTNVLYVDALNNRVGIGTTTPSALVEVYNGTNTGTGSDNAGLYTTSVNRNGFFWASSANGFTSSLIFSSEGTERGRVGYTINNNTMIFNTSLTTRMGVNATGLYVTSLSGSGNRAVYSDPSGFLTNSSSDARLKTNVVTISQSLDLVERLRGVYHYWIDTTRFGADRAIGVIAQEVQPIVPEVVGTNADGTLSVDYPKLTALLIEGLKDVSQYARTLEARIDALAETVARLAPPT